MLQNGPFCLKSKLLSVISTLKLSYFHIEGDTKKDLFYYCLLGIFFFSKLMIKLSNCCKD